MPWIAATSTSSAFMEHTKRVRVFSGFKKVRDSVSERVLTPLSTGDNTEKTVAVFCRIRRPWPALVGSFPDYMGPENIGLMRGYNRHWLAVFSGHTGVL